jgi:ABC-type bacteriocin/lantibiotic exporter with double-glycine peptidase domain
MLASALLGCGQVAYTGKGTRLAPDALIAEPGWIGARGIDLLTQDQSHDCGPTALAMVLRYWDPQLDINPLLRSPADAHWSAAALRDAARARGFESFVVEGTVEDLVREVRAGRPAIVGVAKPTALGKVAHYEVIAGFHPDSQRVALLDPASGWRQISFAGLLEEWLPAGSVLIVVLGRGGPATEPSGNSPVAERKRRSGADERVHSASSRAPHAL